MAVVFILSQALFTAILIYLTDSDVPYINGATAALSVVGMWMLARKYIEQWIVWIVVDILSAGLYCYKGLYLTAVLYALYAIIAIFGYRKWRQMMIEQDATR
jgi:nicotinamide mononucleotide transporter